MDNIRLIQDDFTLELPKTRDISVGTEDVSKEVEMWSGRIVKDIKGFRKTIKAEWDWFPADLMTELLSMLHTGRAVEVEFMDPEYGEDSGEYYITPPEPKIFTYRKGEPIWRGISLEMKGRTVSFNA